MYFVSCKKRRNLKEYHGSIRKQHKALSKFQDIKLPIYCHSPTKYQTTHLLSYPNTSLCQSIGNLPWVDRKCYIMEEYCHLYQLIKLNNMLKVNIKIGNIKDVNWPQQISHIGFPSGNKPQDSGHCQYIYHMVMPATQTYWNKKDQF